MTSLPREVHEVLEQEYVSMYGPLDRVPVEYSSDQIIDVAWALKILRDCHISQETLDRDLASVLNALIDGVLPPSLGESPALTNNGRQLLKRYEDFRSDYEDSRSDAKREELRELNRRILDDAFTGAVTPQRDLRLANVYASLHTRKKEDDGKARTALCISGGGIRSATFALGVIQGLASAKILDKFDYLSTVSGGGYVGSWLSSWARRHPHGISGVREDLALADTAVGGRAPMGDPTAVVPTPERDEKIEPEPQPLRHLRDYSNYLSPRLGILSGDSWTMASLYIRNLLLNLLVFVPILAALLAIPRLYAALMRTPLASAQTFYACGAVAALALAYGYIGAKRPIEGKPSSGADGEYFLACIVPLAIAAVLLTLVWAGAAKNPSVLLGADFMWGGIACLAAMTLVPLAIYYGRIFVARKSAWRTNFTEKSARSRYLWSKFGFELVGAVVGLVAAAGLLALLASIFDDPMQPLSGLFEIANRAPAFRESLTSWAALYVCLAVPAVMLVFSVQASIFVGISSRRSEDYDREWWARAGAWLLVFAAAWAALSAITLFGPVAIYHAPILLGSIGGLSGLAAAALGFSAKTPANAKQKEEGGVAAKAGNAGLGLAVPIFVLFFLALIALGTTWLIQGPKDWQQYGFDAQFQSKAKRIDTSDKRAEVTDETTAQPRKSIPMLQSMEHLRTVQGTSWSELGALLLIAALAAVLSRSIGVNRFSMHALYRNRLIRAYLGASRYARNPNPFTGFDDKDNLRMSDLRPELLWPTNVKDEQALFSLLQSGDPNAKPGPAIGPYQLLLAKHLWPRLYASNQNQLSEPQSATSLDAIIQNLNAILADEKPLLPEGVRLPLPEWVREKAGKVPYPPAVQNRAVLEHYFESAIKPMPRPKDIAMPETALALPNSTFRETGEGEVHRPPLHVVNMALNLVSGEKLAWQQRMAESFTTSPYDSGSLFLGYRDSRLYGGPEGISLGTAVAISGAAASPNMGYHSSPALAFLLTLFNVRLGWWLGNPGPVGEKVYTEGHPRSNLAPIFAEAVGWTNESYDWVYLSDGGHFENLGLYEMVLRRCHYIVLSDAGADPKGSFEDLGNAIRKIRTDLGVPIDVGENFMHPRSADSLLREGKYFTIANIRYTAVDGPEAEDGVLIYLKPGCYKDPCFPRDVYNYALESPDFPHEPTSDQFFSESQFESYRALGRHVINEMCGNYLPTGPITKPITKEFKDVGEFARFIERAAAGAASLPPEELIASAIRQLNR